MSPGPPESQDHQGTLAEKGPRDTREKGAQGEALGNRVLPETAEMTGIKVALVLKERRSVMVLFES